MKTQVNLKNGLLAGLCLIASSALWAQQSIPNGSFEQWDVKSILTPTGYVTSDLENFDAGVTGSCERISDAQKGSYAIRMTTKKLSGSTDEVPGYFVNYQPDGPPDDWHGGMPCNEKPTGIKGFYKSDIKPGDSALILLSFSKNGQGIGSYFYMISGKKTSYTEFNFTLNPPLAQTPDSVIFGAASSNALNEYGIEGSMLQLDNVSLTGVTNQPVDLNGDFENWTNIDRENPTKWYVDTDRDLLSVKTTDKHKGDYAVKLVSYFQEDGDNSKIIPSVAGTGYFTPFGQEGGFPFTNTKDTLTFWYKYTTPGNSKATASYTLKLNRQIEMYSELELDPWNNGFKYVEMPINAFRPSDTLVVHFHSNRWEGDPNHFMNEGATLVIDEVQLKSQKLNTGLRSNWFHSNVKVYPNPAQDYVSITIPANELQEATTLSIVNQLGQEVMRTAINDVQSQISIQALASGIYTYTIGNREKTLKSGKLYIE